MSDYDFNYGYGYGDPAEELFRFRGGGDSGEDLLGLGDYSGYAINEERDYDSGGFDLGRVLSGLGRGALNFASTPRGLLSILAALAAAKGRPRGTKPIGGGVPYGMAAPRQLQEVKNLGKYGDIQRYAAQGGLMQAYAQGGAVRPFPMQDGGFVMTKRAVDGAGGPRGIAQLLPNARMIRGPGTGTSDSIPATIQGRNGVTPAKVSNGESYVPPKGVEEAGGAQALYNLMNNLQRRA